MKRWTVVLLIVVTGTTGCGREPTGREGASELRRPTVEPVPLGLGQEMEPHAPPASSSPEAISESTVTTQRRITIVQSAGTDAEERRLPTTAWTRSSEGGGASTHLAADCDGSGALSQWTALTLRSPCLVWPPGFDGFGLRSAPGRATAPS